MSELHKAAGRATAALHHHEAYHAAERAQFNADSDRQLSALRVQLEVAAARHDAEVHRLKHVEIARAHDELKALHAALLAADEGKSLLVLRLAEQSRPDALTGLANRRWLDEHLGVEPARARRRATPLSAALCDLDDFKRINDRFGHTVGDEVLKRVALILRERCRATDLVARYGGEEFCIAFLETDAALAARSCEALRDAVAAHDWAGVRVGLVVTMSIGVADTPASIERLLADADTQLYRAKHDGKNCVRWVAPPRHKRKGRQIRPDAPRFFASALHCSLCLLSPPPAHAAERLPCLLSPVLRGTMPVPAASGETVGARTRSAPGGFPQVSAPWAA